MTLPIRDDLAAGAAYRWQEGVPEGAEVARFDMNTPPRPPAWYVEAAARIAAVGVQSYPDATYSRLRRRLSEYTGFAPEQIVPTAGADEALQLCALLALRPDDRASAERPCYGMYETLTRLAGATLGDRAEGARLHWRCVPHNPSGADATDADTAEREGLVVIDQAYLEFGGRDLSPLCERPNTVVVRTLSKAFGLAGIRVGYLIASPPLAAALDAIRLPAGISAISAALAELALEHTDEMREAAAATVAERDRMAAALAAAGLSVRPSCANFLLVDTGREAAAVARELAAQRM
ncbi:MAG TPA: histidinol-phosphate transaminase, partial [Gaiellales bacterium]|nr:histidinol-phosphate transaminase [Gaiellales bacterium]